MGYCLIIREDKILFLSPNYSYFKLKDVAMIFCAYPKNRVSKKLVFLLIFLVFSDYMQAQNTKDSIKDSNWNFHFQNTVIYQYHPALHANYSGINSLKTNEETPTSITGTVYLGVKLWKGAATYYNSEISGGSGFSETRGLAGFPNGEVYRVNDASPKIYTARFYIKQVFALSDDNQKIDDAINQLQTNLPTSYVALSAGKFSIMDFFDNNTFSHDPRTQFYNWALMGNGAWDYPANTRGYTYGFVAELVKPKWALRFSAVMVPTYANGPTMDDSILRSRAEVLEFEHKYNIGNQTGTFRFISFLNEANMGNYDDAIKWGVTRNTTPVIDSTKALGRTKFGFGLNIEHNISDNTGLFIRASWNDGRNETWAFTEIDKAISLGLQLNGNIWNHKNDKIGIAILANGLSNEHKNYLETGGHGFIIGDGKLNYHSEMIAELYYSLKLGRYPFWLSPDYQFIVNPAYNKDRGPVNVFGIRAHLEL
jgi:high affinity Mn2+ porin